MLILYYYLNLISTYTDAPTSQTILLILYYYPN